MNQDPLETLERLAQEKLAEVTAWLGSLDPYKRRALFIEVCRVLDYEQVRQLSDQSKWQLSPQEFDIMLRGWNGTVAAMLTPDLHEQGLPAVPSTQGTLRVARSILHEMGLVSVMRKTAAMARHGMADLRKEGDVISVQSLNFGTSDDFLDQIDLGAMPRLNRRERPPDAAPLKSSEAIREEMKGLVFPWNGAPGVTMVGYGATPDVDAYFLDATADQMLEWRDEAGIHPDTLVNGISGGLLTGITGLLASIYMKHIQFVGIGHKKLTDVNFPVSLTIWEPRSQLVQSIHDFIGEAVEPAEVEAALDMLIVSPDNTRYFASAEKPYLPMLIQISDVHVLRPVASIFRNPLHNARMALEFDTPTAEAAFREPREAWMRQELNAMFSGTGCTMMWRPRIIKRQGKMLTDIDAAVYDPKTRCLALFQLKWQDFGAAEVKKQKSRAKNFVSQVDEWTEKVESWIKEVGPQEVAKALELDRAIESVRLFAVGRFVANFKSYGYHQASSSVAVCSWPQIARILNALTDEPDILNSLYERIVEERSRVALVTPIPYEVQIGETRIVFNNVWNEFREDPQQTN